MRTIIAIPPLARMSGGIAVMYQLADRLRELGKEVVLTGMDTGPGLRERAEAGDSVVPWQALSRARDKAVLSAQDIFLIPEGWPNMAAPALNVGARLLVYVQNWAYLFSGLPTGISWESLPVSFLAVSQPVAQYVSNVAQLPLCGIVRPMCDASFFYPRQCKDKKTIRVAWMPRKNKGLAEQIMQICSRLDKANRPRIEWVKIQNKTLSEVATLLSSCQIFLASGFPEGCALPPLEAMSSGCLVVGFSGYGSWDYMRQAIPDGYMPRLQLRPVSWAGNGLYAADGDVLEAALLLHKAVEMVRNDSPQYAAIRSQALLTAAAYDKTAQREEVRSVWARLEGE